MKLFLGNMFSEYLSCVGMWPVLMWQTVRLTHFTQSCKRGKEKLSVCQRSEKKPAQQNTKVNCVNEA